MTAFSRSLHNISSSHKGQSRITSVVVSVIASFLQDKLINPVPNPRSGGPGIFIQFVHPLDELPSKANDSHLAIVFNIRVVIS